MLDHLPHEVISQVCAYLIFRPKLNLAMTCRAFYAKLYNSKLFKNLEILSKNKEAVMKLFHDKNIDTSKIKTLHIISPTEEDSKSTDMLHVTFIPNTQEFAVDKPYVYSYTSRIAESFENLSYLKDTIQKHSDLHGFPAITQLLKVYNFPHLTSLCLEASSTDHTDKPSCVFDKYLKLDFTWIEHLRFQSLKLDKETVDLLSQTLPEQIDPADEMTSFTSTLLVVNDIRYNFFHYIIAKTCLN